MLEHELDVRVATSSGADGLSVETHGAVVSPEQTQDELSDGRLAGPGFSDKTERLSWLDQEIHLINCQVVHASPRRP
jgi:hypothetical protein